MKLHKCKGLKESGCWFDTFFDKNKIQLGVDTHDGCYTIYDVNYCPWCGKKI